jgi:hypothetical protein
MGGSAETKENIPNAHEHINGLQLADAKTPKKYTACLRRNADLHQE